MRTAILLLAALPAAAETPLSGPAFDELTRGRTYYYAEDGIPYGAEEYRPGREVLWSFLDGRCLRGSWYQSGESICFVYENREGPQCWEFFHDDGLRARFLDGGTDLYELGQSADPLYCMGPDVGA
jgi:hypothetical protein